MVNSPNNPSGMVYPESLIKELVELCEERDIYLIMDDIYHKLTFDGITAVSAYKFVTKDINDTKLVILNGVSKVYAMTGFRIGWSVANSELTKAMIRVSAQNSTCPSVILQAAAAGALSGIQSGVESLRLQLQNNRTIMLGELAAMKKLIITPPDGTFYCLPDFRAYGSDSVKMANFLLEKAKVVVVPGVEFGAEGHLRLSYCGTIEEIKWGVERIKWALDPDSPEEIYIGDRLLKRDWL
jgi:aspartate aminotransferase